MKTSIIVVAAIVCIIVASGVVYFSVSSVKDNEISKLNSQINTLNSQINNLSSQVDDLNSQVHNLNDLISDLTTGNALYGIWSNSAGPDTNSAVLFGSYLIFNIDGTAIKLGRNFVPDMTFIHYDINGNNVTMSQTGGFSVTYTFSFEESIPFYEKILVLTNASNGESARFSGSYTPYS